MLDEQGHLKLIDFGSAKDLGAGPAPVQQAPQRRNSLQQIQRSASMVGTAEYLAPEACQNLLELTLCHSHLNIQSCRGVSSAAWPNALAGQVVMSLQAPYAPGYVIAICAGPAQ